MPSPPAPQTPLLPGECHLWLTRTEGVTPEVLATATDLLSPPERARAARFLVEPARLEYILSRSLVRRALSAHTGVDPRAFRFDSGPRGKPFIASPVEYRDIEHNLTHSRGVAACAVMRGARVGVDVEETKATAELENIAHLVFSPPGAATFSRLNGEAQRRYFFAKWTLKEAFVKTRGDGLSLGVERIQITFTSSPESPDGLRLQSMTLDGQDILPTHQVHRFSLTPHHPAALVIESPTPIAVMLHSEMGERDPSIPRW
ncbi:MAG: 4'-phosphopantetheinyl transferase superfamily protein [Polyangiaceae bacterium]